MSAEWFGIPKDKIAHFLMFFPYPALITLVFCKAGWSPVKFIGFLLAVLAGAVLLTAAGLGLAGLLSGLFREEK